MWCGRRIAVAMAAAYVVFLAHCVYIVYEVVWSWYGP